MVALLTKSDEEVCYDIIDCFEGLTVFNKTYLPEPPEKIATSFRVFTKPNPFRFKEIHYRNESSLSLVKKSSPIVFIIHGWVIASDSLMYIQLRHELFNQYETVVSVDWRNGADADSYPQSAVNTAIVGRETGYLIKLLLDKREIEPDQVYLIGFSLGAHVAGAAGRWLSNKYSSKVARITALDGAGPLIGGTKYSLKIGDAALVDAIHTNGGDIENQFIGHLGYASPLGDLDFFPNGGQDQPNCAKNTADVTCNHHAAIYYYISSIKTCSYVATKCNSWSTYLQGNCSYPDTMTARMGFYSFQSQYRGSFYLVTSEFSPYCEVNRKQKFPFSRLNDPEKN
ncbi:pancreatic lipase-related protein 2 [Tetranychus urticae]|nr:pancreatic lipase-related protein 2 [Tetranychus urticae]